MKPAIVCINSQHFESMYLNFSKIYFREPEFFDWKSPLRSSSPTTNLKPPSPPHNHVPKHCAWTYRIICLLNIKIQQGSSLKNSFSFLLLLALTPQIPVHTYKISFIEKFLKLSKLPEFRRLQGRWWFGKAFSEFHYGFSMKHLIVLMKPLKVSFICPMACLFHLAPGEQHRIIKACVFHGEQSYLIITVTPDEQYKIWQRPNSLQHVNLRLWFKLSVLSCLKKL